MLPKLILRLAVPLRSGILMLRSAANQHIGAHAAGICFFALLALFPTAILVCSVLSSVGFTANDLAAMLQPLLPAALLPLSLQLMEGFFAARSVGTLSATALLALWSASRGVYGLMRGINAVCCMNDRRSFLRKRFVCAAYLLTAVMALPAALLAHMMGYTFLIRLGVLLPLVQHLFSFLSLGAFFSAIYAAFPAAKLHWQVCLLGGFLAASGCQLFTAVFSVYALTAKSYSTFYGSLRFCALGLLWMYFCCMILLFGGLLSAAMHRRLTEPN